MQELFEFLKNNSDVTNAFTAICALLMSFLAIALGVASLIVQRQHNFKSLTPIAEIRFYDYEDHVAVRIANAGIGPLMLEEFIATDGNNSFDNLISLMPTPPEGIVWDTFYERINGISIRPNEEATILSLTGENLNNSAFTIFRDAVRKELSKFTVYINYRDIYDRKMSTVSRSLEWFGTHVKGISKHKQRPIRRA